MKISTKGRYGLRVLIDLAEHSSEDQRETLRAISDRQKITIKYLEQIMVPLLQDGYIKSFRGHSGGYVLSRRPADIRIGDVVRTMEGSLAPVACLESDADHCPMAADCPTLALWQGLEAIIEAYLDQISLADLINDTVEDFVLIRRADYLKEGSAHES
ncbi:RrF2 family transcriptional regulator [Peptococcus simiae]|uniref:RrF2 family transcriptional regulator n=1 Tax=Peptococcus simiae TaxID=1643805 RepID=A0ABW9GYF7_9FIRM